MVFYLIGLGLGDVEDITVKGLKIVKWVFLKKNKEESISIAME